MRLCTRRGAVPLPLEFLLGAALVLLASLVLAQNPDAGILDVQQICRTDGKCRVKVKVVTDTGTKIVVTAFHANRVGPDMKYVKGDEYGNARVPDAGLFYFETPVVIDEEGTMRGPEPDDDLADHLDLITNLAVDPRGHVTFYYCYIRGPDSPFVLRSYLWGYPPTTVQTIGSIGGPRSPVAAREFPPPRIQKGGIVVHFGVVSNPRNRCRVTVIATRDAETQMATTYFRANRVGEDMRYFPSEREGGMSMLVGGGTYCLDLRVSIDERGGLRTPNPDDGPGDIDTLTTTVALDDRGHVTFFYGFVRSPESSYVKKFLLWGYSPVTLMVDTVDGDEPSDRAQDEHDERI